MPRMDDERVSVVIPSWNGKELLAECLKSLNMQTYRSYGVTVVDDGSSDDTDAMLRWHFPEVRRIRFKENRGFCVAVNEGIRQTDGDLILLINNDVTVAPHFISRLVEAAETSNAAMFAPLILWRDSPTIVYAAGDLQRAGGRPESAGFRVPLDGFRFPQTIFGVTAAAALYRRTLFDAVGLFDPVFGAYFSDSDLCFRARLAGFDARFVREAIAYHVGSASLGSSTLKRTRECYVNHALLIAKDMPAPLIARHFPAIAWERLHQARRLFSATRNDHGAVGAVRSLAAAWLDLIRKLPHALRERRKIQRARKIPLRRLEKMLVK
ncbi:MAG TPA: glycosyltransferase family 2 protein [Candidatus Hydrogenedentes bacterium]|nr:glycosyltransferase family 2 protein [Candidatus Hydrogenedentota bacterium]HPC14873.1 glycosyltransferase family 2 protein [Candidatus Hydrogenedentota bacterium]HRT18737.1 glycosyltransferase family 2 protein [Candidatus Hydrogenedentota bacterium]HRT63757.1 glycosyltransferase family 2 protein [Candidatus Hydrogenedentota bacterium]